MTLSHPERILLANLPTPMQKLENYSRELGVDLYAKRDDMSSMELSGNKVRKLEFLLPEAKKKGADTVVTCGGIQSNHCRATAAACVRVGLKCHLILRAESPSAPFDGNLLLDYLFGAEFTFMPQPEYRKNEQLDFSCVLDKIRENGGKPYYIPVGGSVPMGSWGYALAFEEIVDQLREKGLKRAHLIVASGSGGTHNGLVLGRALLNKPEFKITSFNVCDTPEYFVEKNRQMLKDTIRIFDLSIDPERESFDLIGGYVGPGYAMPYPELMQTICEAAKKEALLLDPVYTGKAFHGLVSEIRENRFPKEDPIVFIHTGGAFGLFPQKGEFQF